MGGYPPQLLPPQNNTNTTRTLLAQKGHEMVIGTFVRKTDYADSVWRFESRAGGAIRCDFPLQAIFLFLRRLEVVVKEIALNWILWQLAAPPQPPRASRRPKRCPTALPPLPKTCSRPNTRAEVHVKSGRSDNQHWHSLKIKNAEKKKKKKIYWLNHFNSLRQTGGLFHRHSRGKSPEKTLFWGVLDPANLRQVGTAPGLVLVGRATPDVQPVCLL